MELFNIAVVSVLLYNCETWVINKEAMEQLNAFHFNSVKRVTKCNWKSENKYEYISRVKLLKKFK